VLSQRNKKENTTNGRGGKREIRYLVNESNIKSSLSLVKEPAT